MAVSREAVTWGYRFFLGREPESQQVIDAHLAATDETHLAELLIRSSEFGKTRLFPKIEGPLLPLNLPPLPVETDATPEQLGACVVKIKQAWTHLGLLRPHFSVLTETRFLPDNLSASLEAFWASGDREAQIVCGILLRHGFSSLTEKACVEYGCGVGRVTMALARRFARVAAYDISQSHLGRAADRQKELGITNVRLHECASSFLATPQSCDFFYSRIVFQHNPPPVIVELIRRAFAALKRNGIAILQVPTYIAGYRFEIEQWLRTEHPLDMQMHCLPQSKVFLLIAEAGCTVLEVREDDAAGERTKVLSNTFVVRKT